jgi:hypothetical protein
MALTERLDSVPLDRRLGSAAMEGSSNAGVTPEGVRAGDRDALQALVDRRGPAVVAFCTQVCGPPAADRAAAEAFARFRAAVRDAPDLTALNPEALLRGATRHAAASMARQPSGPPPHGRLRSRGTQTCEHVPTMLAARANGALGAADLERLARHLDRCERCDALAEIFRRAELAYQDPAVDTLGTDTTSVLIDALLAVSEHGHGIAPAPADDAVAAEPLDGAFGHLPELDDELPVVVSVPEADAEALDAADLAIEPLSDTPPTDLVPGDEDADFGETIEWDNELPELAPGPKTFEPIADAALLTGGKARRGSGPRPLMVLLPALLIVVLAVGAMALAGVFDGDNGTATISKPPAPRVQAPVLTPLPVTVKKPVTKTETTASSSTPATTASATTPATTATATSTTATGETLP